MHEQDKECMCVQLDEDRGGGLHVRAGFSERTLEKHTEQAFGCGKGSSASEETADIALCLCVWRGRVPISSASSRHCSLNNDC